MRNNPVDFLGGAKLVGRIGEFSVAGLDVVTDKAKEIHRENYSAFRVQKDILKSSTVGVLATSKHELRDGTSGYRWIDGALALDSYLALGKDLALYPSVAVIRHPHHSIDKNRWAYYLSFERMGTAPLQFKLRYVDIGENFTSSTAYIPYQDIRGVLATLDYNWWVRKHGIYRLNPYGSYERYTDHHDVKTQDHFYLGFGTMLINMTDIYLTRYEYYFGSPQYNMKTSYDFWELYLGSNTWRSVVGSASYRVGTQYSLFGKSSTRWLTLGQKWYRLRDKNWDKSYRHLILSSQFKPLDRLQLTLNVENVHFDFLNSERADTSSSQWIVSVRSHLLVMPKLSFKAFYQSDRKDETTDVNLLVEYNYLPGSYVYLVYNRNEDLVQTPGETELTLRKEDLVFIKVDYWLNL